MFQRLSGKNQLADPSEKLKALPLVGETIRLSGGGVLQKPNPDLIKALQAIDGRVRYFPTDPKAIEHETGRFVYFRGVTDLLPARIMRDFPGSRIRTVQRGTVVSLRDEWPHFVETAWAGTRDSDDPIRLPKRVPTGKVDQMNSVLTILKTGSDRAGPVGRTGAINEDGELNVHSCTYSLHHSQAAIDRLVKEGEYEKADNIFPGFLVYETEVLRDTSTLPEERLAAIYIVDRFISTHDIEVALGGYMLKFGAISRE